MKINKFVVFATIALLAILSLSSCGNMNGGYSTRLSDNPVEEELIYSDNNYAVYVVGYDKIEDHSPNSGEVIRVSSGIFLKLTDKRDAFSSISTDSKEVELKVKNSESNSNIMFELDFDKDIYQYEELKVPIKVRSMDSEIVGDIDLVFNNLKSRELS